MEEKVNQYPVGFYFSIAFDDTAQGFFKEVSGLSKEMKVEEVTAGGENRFKYRLPTGLSSNNIVLKRGLFSNTSPLLTWCVKNIDGGLSQPIQTKDITICLVNQEGNASMKWVFIDAYPIKYAVSDLKSQENEVVIESIELAYTYFTNSPMS